MEIRRSACRQCEADAIERRGDYEDVAGFSFSAKLDDIKEHGHVLTPGRFVGAEDEEDDGVPFEAKFTALKNELEEQFAEGNRLKEEIGSKLDLVIEAVQ